MPAYTHRNEGSTLVETLVTTTVDTITLPTEAGSFNVTSTYGDAVTVWNLSGASDILAVASSVAVPADPSAGAFGVVSIPAGQFRTLAGLGSQQATLKVVGSGNTYAVLRTNAPRAATSTPPIPLRTFVTIDVASLIDGAGANQTVTLQGAALGMFARASWSIDVQGMTLAAYVSAANTVTVRVQNESGGTVDLASATVEVVVWR